MLVTILGPNLIDQSKGQFEIHAAGCFDLLKVKYIGGMRGIQDQVEIEVPDRKSVIEDVYVDFIDEDGSTWSDFQTDFNFMNCCKNLPKEA